MTSINAILGTGIKRKGLFKKKKHYIQFMKQNYTIKKYIALFLLAKISTSFFYSEMGKG